MGHDFLILGDYNETPGKGALGWCEANGFVRNLDDDHGTTTITTQKDQRGPGRHIDFATASTYVWAIERHQHEVGFSDHDAIEYRFDWNTDSEVRVMPARKHIPRTGEDITEEEFNKVWNKKTFDHTDAETYWRHLSDTAEALLAEGEGVSRASEWEPRRRMTTHKGAEPEQSVRLRRLLRLQRRLTQLKSNARD